MLTREEVVTTINEAMTTEPVKLNHTLANYMPQDTSAQLIDDIFDHAIVRGYDPEIAQLMTAQFMMGFHVAWYLAIKALKK